MSEDDKVSSSCESEGEEEDKWSQYRSSKEHNIWNPKGEGIHLVHSCAKCRIADYASWSMLWITTSSLTEDDERLWGDKLFYTLRFMLFVSVCFTAVCLFDSLHKKDGSVLHRTHVVLRWRSITCCTCANTLYLTVLLANVIVGMAKCNVLGLSPFTSLKWYVLLLSNFTFDTLLVACTALFVLPSRRSVLLSEQITFTLRVVNYCYIFYLLAVEVCRLDLLLCVLRVCV